MTAVNRLQHTRPLVRYTYTLNTGSVPRHTSIYSFYTYHWFTTINQTTLSYSIKECFHISLRASKGQRGQCVDFSIYLPITSLDPGLCVILLIPSPEKRPFEGPWRKSYPALSVLDIKQCAVIFVIFLVQWRHLQICPACRYHPIPLWFASSHAEPEHAYSKIKKNNRCDSDQHIHSPCKHSLICFNRIHEAFFVAIVRAGGIYSSSRIFLCTAI